MVDASAAMRAGRTGEDWHGREETSVVVASAEGDALEAYERLAIEGIAAPAQSAAWVRAWLRHVKSDAFLATSLVGDRPVLSLALEVGRLGPASVASFISGRHANGNFPALAPKLAGTLTRADLAKLFAGVKRARPDIDVVRLERLAPQIRETRNPLLQLEHHPSPNLALALSLEGGFDAVLERSSAKRKRKKHRSQTRKFEAAGGFRLIRASTPQEVERLLAAFFEMKEHRFRKMGIANVFGEAEVRSFFLDLFTTSAGPSPAFVLDGLEVGGKLRAVTGSSACEDRLICEFGTIAEDELTQASPGDFLFFENICAAAKSGFEVYDFSVGDEPYKRLWSNIELTQYDVLVPLTMKGRAVAAAMRAATAAKSLVKGNPVLWNLAKRLRKQAARADAEAPDRD